MLKVLHVFRVMNQVPEWTVFSDANIWYSQRWCEAQATLECTLARVLRYHKFVRMQSLLEG